MNCGRAEALFEAYLDDTLVPARRARMLAHVNRCGRCKGVLDELRVVDALLASPRQLELPQHFTFATMAEVRGLPPPRASSAPLVAYLVSYLAAAWLLFGAGLVLANGVLRAFGETAFDVSFQAVRALSAFAHTGARIFGDESVGTAAAIVILLDVALVVGFITVRPRLAQRLRL